MRRLILSIDQGTTSSKVLLMCAASGDVLAESAAPVGITYPRPGWVEQDATDIWNSVMAAAGQCLSGATAADVIGVAISNQRESVVAWHATTGEALGPVLGWQDSRTAAWCATQGAHDALIRERTGLQVDAMFSAPKIRWLLADLAARGFDLADVRVGTIDSWLIYRLTGEHLIEAGNASRTLLLNTKTVAWDDDLLAIFDVPRSVLPEVRPSTGPFGSLRSGALDGLAGIPVAAVLADSHSALYHHGQGRSGVGKATYGTGSSVMLPKRERKDATLAWWCGLDTIAALPTQPPGGLGARGVPQFAAEGNILTSGAGLDWMARTLGAPDGMPGGAFLTELATTESDAGGVSFVPAFTGLGAPHWDRDATGTLTGITGGTTRGNIARAALDAVAHQVADVIEAVGTGADLLVADGGATRSELLMQTQADLLGRPVEVSASPHASALGVADLAALVLTGTAPAPTKNRIVYLPQIGDDERLARRVAWRQAVRRARGQALYPTTT